MAQGMEDVTITDEKGQVYSTREFVDFIEDPPDSRKIELAMPTIQQRSSVSVFR